MIRATLKPILLACTLAASSAVFANTPLPNEANAVSVGTVNCTTSTCHGAVTPWDGSNVLQNEYTTWSRLDPHARAYHTLLTDQSKRIAEKLGLKQGAHNAKECLDCHAHNPMQKLRGERFDITDGVNCEGCHGPAEKWIKSHTVDGTTHADNVKNGLFPTSNPREQARMCLSCHQGSESKPMTHRIMGAGHPRISFELDTFNSIVPAHWRVDDDYRKRKGTPDNIKIWALGQGIAVEELLTHLLDPKRGRDGLFPELVLFDCHACHHPMSKDQYSSRTGVGPGRIRLNDSNMLMMRALVNVVDASGSKAFNDQVVKLHQAVSDGKGDAMMEARKLLEDVRRYNKQFENRSFTNTDLQGVMKALITEAGSGVFSDYAGAEQAYMAISSIATGLSKRGALANAKEVNVKLAALRKTLANDEKYRPADFQKELLNLRNAAFVQVK